MKSIKQNWFKISIVVILLIVAGVIVYYYTRYLPAQNKEKQLKQEQSNLFDRNIDCQKYDQKITETESGILKMKFHSGVFFSPKVNSCLYAGLDWDDKIKVKDALSLQTVFEEELKDMKAGQTGQEVDRLISEYKRP